MAYQKHGQWGGDEDEKCIKMRYDQQPVWFLATHRQPATGKSTKDAIIENISNSPHTTLPSNNNTETIYPQRPLHPGSQAGTSVQALQQTIDRVNNELLPLSATSITTDVAPYLLS